MSQQSRRTIEQQQHTIRRQERTICAQRVLLETSLQLLRQGLVDDAQRKLIAYAENNGLPVDTHQPTPEQH